MQHLENIVLLKVDIKSISAKVKTLELIDLYEAKILCTQTENAASLEQAKRLFLLANLKFESGIRFNRTLTVALSSNTNSSEILFWWARSILYQSNTILDKKKAKEVLYDGLTKIKRCCQISNDYIDAIFVEVEILLRLASLASNIVFILYLLIVG